jgi:phosphoribosylanthranilate isomerase
MTVVKICGITNLDDALCAVDAGAGMLGFIFYPKSPRYIAPEAVQGIVRAVRARTETVTTVGVFVNESAQMMAGTLDAAGLDLAQLSGDEPPEVLATLGGRAYKAVRTAAGAQAQLRTINVLNTHPSRPDMLLDADHPTLYGGSGERADECLATQMAHQCRLLLAGGLRPDNVAEVIGRVHPWGVDVSSGVEATPGKKDHAKVNAFVQAVHSGVWD